MLNEKLNELIAEAMKSHNEVRTRTLRLIKAAFLEASKAPGANGQLDDFREIQVLQKMVKQRQDARQQYIDANRIELAKNEYEEKLIIEEFLPKPVSKEEIVEYIEELFLGRAKEGAEPFTKKDMGALIKLVKTEYPGADGKLVSDIVKERLI